MWQNVKTAFLLGLMDALFLGVGTLVGHRSGLIIAAIFALVMNVFAYWNSDKLAIAAARGQSVSPEAAADPVPPAPRRLPGAARGGDHQPPHQPRRRVRARPRGGPRAPRSAGPGERPAKAGGPDPPDPPPGRARDRAAVHRQPLRRQEG